MPVPFQHRPDAPHDTDESRLDSQIQGMAIVGQVAGGILHDFNNILTVITGTIDILAQAVGDRPELAAVARLIDEAATRGARLTSQLLAFSRGRPPQPCSVDIEQVLTDVARLLRPSLGIEIDVTTTVADGTPRVFADPGQLMAALLCLAMMARDAMDGRGGLAFAARASAIDGQADAGRHADAGVVTVLTALPSGTELQPDRMLSDIRIVEDFVRRSNGRLRIDTAAGSRIVVEVVLPTGAVCAQG
jgi:nitrogen fixation/metabolism regulation signal transduction histidine kinase